MVATARRRDSAYRGPEFSAFSGLRVPFFDSLKNKLYHALIPQTLQAPPLAGSIDGL